MVYCGKPSASCGHCRSRRIKVYHITIHSGTLTERIQCDLIRPKCTPCIRSGRDCPGYRDAAELMFRDETSTTVAKHQKRQPPRDKYENTTKIATVTILVDGQKCDTNVSHKYKSRSKWHEQQEIKETLYCLDQSISDLALNLLLTKYVIGSHFEFLPVLCRVSTYTKPFRLALQSVALARLANNSKWQDLSKLAWKQYNLALCETRRTLEYADSAASDDNIATVLLLSSFEMISADVEASTQSWTKHVRGAHALLTMRGRQFLHSGVRRQMFRQIATSITLDCLQTQTRMPESLLEMMSFLRSGQTAFHPNHRMQIIVENFIDFRASIAEGKITRLQDIITITEDMDNQAQNLTEDMLEQDEFKYEIIAHDDSSEIDTDVHPLGIFYCQYSCPAVAQLWNSIRMLRILLNEIIYNTSLQLFKSQPCTSSLDNEFPPPLIRASKISKTTTNLCRDICASVPLSPSESASKPLSNTTSKQHENWEYDSWNQDRDQIPDPVPAVNFLIWPLFKAGSSQHVPRYVREYATKQLRELGIKHRVQRAVFAAEQLEKGVCSDDWMHVCHMF
ncbi:hypothetical protein H2198_001370 [Neophaeococcomyces mojaviensis]|uniref:Uncharacterized protein n=1 Tax=Neophaeococcomyces mojaviensis TaxID=3383035 RepID=A0ACC3AH67_9EURO|nr:hypothetical protein H2198_001370 [Knufia sp. JES_112]